MGGPRLRWMGEAHTHALRIAVMGSDRVRTVVRHAVRARVRAEAIDRLRRLDVTYGSYDFVLNFLAQRDVHFGDLNHVQCTRFSLRTIVKIFLGGLPVARTRAHFQLKDQLIAAGIDGNLRRTCLFCLFSRNICVLESEWHLLFIAHFSRTYVLVPCGGPLKLGPSLIVHLIHAISCARFYRCA